MRGQCRFDENDDMVLEPLEVKRLLCAPLSACLLTLLCNMQGKRHVAQ